MKRPSSSSSSGAGDASGEKPTHRTADRHDAQHEEQQQLDAFLVVVLEGPDRGASVQVDAASPSRVLIGTSPACDLRLSDREVSRRHASLRVNPNGRELLIADLGSTNGTSVNNVSLREAALRGGEVVRIGQTVLSVSIAEAGRPSSLAATRDSSFGRLLGESLAMRKLYPTLHRLAAMDTAILLEGEAGTGKELCAEEIHAHSKKRSVRPFVSLAANAVPLDEIEHRLFAPEEGLTAQATGGTLFIDEVASLALSTQRRLLDVMSAAKTETSVRFIMASRRDLDREVMLGRFDERLFGLLAKGRIELPPLRERIGDVALLARSFWKTLREEEANGEVDVEGGEQEEELPNDFLPRFESYPWPGNVRELLSAVRARVTLGELAPWRSGMEADVIASVIDRELPLGEARKIVIDDFERRYVAYMMARFGNTRDAARASGVALRYLQLLRARLLP